MTDETADVIGHGGNLTAVKKEIKKGVDEIISLKDERTGINAQIAEVRARMVTHGIPKKALDMAMQYMNMDEDKREGFDVAYQIVREAIGLPVQGELHLEGDAKK